MDWRKILGVSEQATSGEIKHAYKTLANKYHPDKGGDASKFIQVKQAYDRLKTVKPKKYKVTVHVGPQDILTKTITIEILVKKTALYFQINIPSDVKTGDKVIYRDSLAHAEITVTFRVNNQNI